MIRSPRQKEMEMKRKKRRRVNIRPETSIK